VIRAVTLSAVTRNWEVLGLRHGFRALIEDSDDFVALNRDAVRGIHHLGGSILGSTNRGNPFRYPVLRDGQYHEEDLSQRVVDRFRELELEALITIGGDGSIRIAELLLERGLPRVIAVPKTIDNDLPGTDITFGFGTAVATATDAIDKLHTTAQAHERVMVVEVMGRYAGWIALHAGVAGGADVILIPELPFDLERVCEKVRARYASGRRFAIVVAAEGARPAGGDMSFRALAGVGEEHARLGGIAERVATEIAQRCQIDTRSLVLGHLQRGGSPVTGDRILALRFGCAATHFLEACSDSGLVAMRKGEIQLVPLSEGTQHLRTVPPDDDTLRTARSLGVCFGDETAGSFS
jgi:6-phosphofructokinase 1